MKFLDEWDVFCRLVPQLAAGCARLVAIQRTSLRTGLTAEQVVRITVRYVDAAGGPGLLRLVAKTVRGRAARESALYRSFLTTRVPAIAPRLLACCEDGDSSILFLECVTSSRRWPWNELAHAASVMQAAAQLHSIAVSPDVLPVWDYEGELAAAAAGTLEYVEANRRNALLGIDSASARAVRRLVRALPLVRRALAAGPLAPAVIHGDLHTGNVALRFIGGRATPVFLDWERARIGSPLEDVSSWLQTLAFWEPEARRRHDTLLAAYLAARGMPSQASPEVRSAYWVAGASNALAGALVHHLGRIGSLDARPAARARSRAVVGDWLRVIRRADAVLLEGERRSARGARDHRSTGRAVRTDSMRFRRWTRSTGAAGPSARSSAQRSPRALAR